MLAVALLGTALLVVTGCTSGQDAGGASTAGDAAPAAAPAPPPPPPAACLLDTAALAASTGLTWTPDATTASDTRCVYDPAPAASTSPAPTSGAAGAGVGASDGAVGDGGAFVAVDIAAASDDPPAAQLDVVAQLCDPGSRTPTAGTGFVCRFHNGSVFAGLVRGDEVVTVAASAVPAGTTTAALVVAFGQQLDALA